MKHWNNSRAITFSLACVLAFSMNTVALATDFFVATTGNDTNSGTISFPFRTLEKGVSVMESGDRLLIRAGTYQRGPGQLDVPSGRGSWSTATTIAAYNGEKVILTPYDRTTGTGSIILDFSNGRSWIIIDGLILDGVRHASGQGGGRFGISLSYGGHHFRIINTEIRHMGSVGIHTFNANYNEFINLKIHDNNHGWPSDHPNFNRRVYGIYLESDHNLMKGCDIYNNRGYGISMYSGHDYKPNNNTFIGNKLHHNEMSGITISSGAGSILINNLVYGNGTGATSGYAGDSRYGIEINWGSSQTFVYNNTMFGNVGGELMLGPSGGTVTAKNNILYGTSSSHHALRIYSGSKNSVVQHNLIYHKDPQKLISNAEPTATESDNLVGPSYNPLFVNADANDFHLSNGSFAIGKGIVLTEVKIDFDGVERNLGRPLDIGAYVFVGSSSLPDATRPAPPSHVQIY